MYRRGRGADRTGGAGRRGRLRRGEAVAPAQLAGRRDERRRRRSPALRPLGRSRIRRVPPSPEYGRYLRDTWERAVAAHPGRLQWRRARATGVRPDAAGVTVLLDGVPGGTRRPRRVRHRQPSRCATGGGAGDAGPTPRLHRRPVAGGRARRDPADGARPARRHRAHRRRRRPDADRGRREGRAGHRGEPPGVAAAEPHRGGGTARGAGAGRLRPAARRGPGGACGGRGRRRLARRGRRDAAVPRPAVDRADRRPSRRRSCGTWPGRGSATGTGWPRRSPARIAGAACVRRAS